MLLSTKENNTRTHSFETIQNFLLLQRFLEASGVGFRHKQNSVDRAGNIVHKIHYSHQKKVLIACTPHKLSSFLRATHFG